MIIAETNRLLLRHFHVLDCEAMCAVFGDPEVMRFGQGVKNREWVQDWLRRCLSKYFSEWGFGLWAAVEKDSCSVIGYCGLSYFPNICGCPEVEVGYRLIHSKWGQGLATEAAQAVRDYGFDKLNIHRLIALIDPKNDLSIRVAEKLGMFYEKDYQAEGSEHVDKVYVVCRDF